MNKAEFDTVIDRLGVPATHRQAKAPNTETAIARLTIQGVGKADEAVVQAYGVMTRQIHIKSASLPAAPEKFDAIIIGGITYVIEAVMPKFESGTGAVLGYACYCKGK